MQETSMVHLEIAKLAKALEDERDALARKVVAAEKLALALSAWKNAGSDGEYYIAVQLRNSALAAWEAAQ